MLSPTSALLGTVILASVLPSLPISALFRVPFPSLSSTNEISGLYVGAVLSPAIASPSPDLLHDGSVVFAATLVPSYTSVPGILITPL